MIAGRLLHIRLATALLLLGALSACVGPAREPVDSLSGLNGGETVVVGRIELVPPLRKNEQKLKGLGTGNFENKIILISDDQYRTLTDEPGMADYAGRIEAKFGQTFFVRSDSKPFYILGGMMFSRRAEGVHQTGGQGGLHWHGAVSSQRVLRDHQGRRRRRLRPRQCRIQEEIRHEISLAQGAGGAGERASRIT
jgi:hypothetical protein